MRLSPVPRIYANRGRELSSMVTLIRVTLIEGYANPCYANPSSCLMMRGCSHVVVQQPTFPFPVSFSHSSFQDFPPLLSYNKLFLKFPVSIDSILVYNRNNANMAQS